MGWNIIGRENPKCLEKTCSGAYLSTKNPIWMTLGLSLGRLHGEYLATNFLGYIMSLCVCELNIFNFQYDLFLKFILYGVFMTVGLFGIQLEPHFAVVIAAN
jgi:hypothetical protein